MNWSRTTLAALAATLLACGEPQDAPEEPAPVEAPVVSAPASVTATKPYVASITPKDGLAYAWSLSNAEFQAGSGPAGTSGDPSHVGFVPTEAGTPFRVSVRATSLAGGFATGTHQGTVHPAPSAATIAAPTAAIATKPCAASIPAPQAGLTTTWSLSNASFAPGSTASGQGADPTTIQFDPTAPGTFEVWVEQRNALGVTATGHHQGTAYPPATSPQISVAATIPAGGMGNAMVAAQAGGVYFSWTISQDGTFADGTSSASGQGVGFIAGPAGPGGTPGTLTLSATAHDVLDAYPVTSTATVTILP
jgi:hypothetical protein